ncbi:MAG: methyltransferase domain-containing protein [Azonexus sp.]|uniref:methyltransferase domain-containing protein n=1 Tax=Azonexus sp. TaxID=1872668 RepID=UPI002825AD0A|nr:methyltransferase domain-containing protein [Azonexus sp.]MDR0776457.1 methyltransferase domain-containing protein [Azonexus sp.]
MRPSASPPKTRVRQAFERAAPTYDGAAGIQREICHALLATLTDIAPPAVLLDAGAGTGYALPLLAERFPTAERVAVDLSAAMLARIAMPCRRLVGDLEQLPLAAACLDLYWSSLAVQWCELPRALAEARRVLRPAGRLAVATLGPETFEELRQAFADVDNYRHTLVFHTPEEIARLATEAGFTGIAVGRRRLTAHYPDFRGLLRAVKASGANQLGNGRRRHLMGRAAFAAAEAAAERQRSAAGLPLTYDVLILEAQR